MKVCFLLNDLKLSGGVATVVSHAQHLAHHQGFDVTLALTGSEESTNWDYTPGDAVRLIRAGEATERFDVVIATWWETVHELFQVDADRHAYFVQSLEDRFYRPGDPERIGAALTHELPVAVITEARWIADIIEQLRPGLRCYYVRNGIDKDVFQPLDDVAPRPRGPLRVLIEGHPDVWIKAVGEAAAAASQMTAEHVTTLVSPDAFVAPVAVDRRVGPLTLPQMAELYRETDVVLKLSRVEGMFGPPLEAFHMGASCVVTPVTGHDEYVVHGWNGVVVDWDDPRGTARWLDLLAVNRQYLHFLRHNALHTARAWPSQRQSSQFMAAALKQILHDPPPRIGTGAFGVVLAGIEDYRNRTIFMRSQLDQARSWVNRLKATRAYGNPVIRFMLWPARLAYRAARRISRRR